MTGLLLDRLPLVMEVSGGENGGQLLPMRVEDESTR